MPGGGYPEPADSGRFRFHPPKRVGYPGPMFLDGVRPYAALRSLIARGAIGPSPAPIVPPAAAAAATTTGRESLLCSSRPFLALELGILCVHDAGDVLPRDLLGTEQLELGMLVHRREGIQKVGVHESLVSIYDVKLGHS